jgi:hypothetical protein
MPTVLHLVKGDATPLVSATLERQAAAGDRITLVLLEGAPAPAHPETVIIYRVPGELTHAQLLDLIFESDQVITW